MQLVQVSAAQTRVVGSLVAAVLERLVPLVLEVCRFPALDLPGLDLAPRSFIIHVKTCSLSASPASLGQLQSTIMDSRDSKSGGDGPGLFHEHE